MPPSYREEVTSMLLLLLLSLLLSSCCLFGFAFERQSFVSTSLWDVSGAFSILVGLNQNGFQKCVGRAARRSLVMYV